MSKSASSSPPRPWRGSISVPSFHPLCSQREPVPARSPDAAAIARSADQPATPTRIRPLPRRPPSTCHCARPPHHTALDIRPSLHCPSFGLATSTLSHPSKCEPLSAPACPPISASALRATTRWSPLLYSKASPPPYAHARDRDAESMGRRRTWSRLRNWIECLSHFLKALFLTLHFFYRG